MTSRHLCFTCQKLNVKITILPIIYTQGRCSLTNTQICDPLCSIEADHKIHSVAPIEQNQRAICVLSHTSFGQKGFALLLKLKIVNTQVLLNKNNSPSGLPFMESHQLLTVNTEEQMNCYASKGEADQNTGHDMAN